MGYKKQLSKIIDSAVLSVFQRARYHRELGMQYINYARNELPSVLHAVGKEHSSYLENNLANYKNWAYLDVQGQALLIDADICNIDVKSRQPAPNQAALATGLLWYSIKLVDNYIDENSLRKRELEDFISLAQDSWRNGNLVKILSPEKQKIINATSSLLHSGYVGNPSGYLGKIKELCDADLLYISSCENRVESSKEVGRKSAELTIQLAKQYIPEYPNGLEEFLIEQGITGKLFDDFKDINLDRKFGRGYENKEIPNLMIQGIKHFCRHFKTLPTIEQKWRNINFIALAALFHVREILGEKEKS